MVLGMASRARARKGDRLSSFGLIDCTEESLSWHRHSTMGRHMGRGTMQGSPGQCGHREGWMR